MAIGPKEAQRRALREIRASGSRETRTASPSGKEIEWAREQIRKYGAASRGAAEKKVRPPTFDPSARDTPRKGGDGRTGSKKASAPPPAGVSKSSERPAAVGKKAVRGRPRGPDRTPVLVELEPSMLARVNSYQKAAGLTSRTAAIRALIEKGLK